MAERVINPECDVLRSLSGIKCPSLCTQPPAYSFFQDGRGRGCWVAHTALTLIEAIDLMKEVENALVTRNIKPRCIIAAALLHDVGKLSQEYTERRYLYHNIASAAVCLEALKHWTKEERSTVAQAVLLHHEERMWRGLQKPGAPFIADYYNLIKRKKLKVNMIKNYVGVLDILGKVVEFLPQAKEVFDELSSSLKLSSYSLLPSHELDLTEQRLAPRFLPLYYLLQLADNRAASAREGLYWRDILNQAARNAGDDPEEFTKALMTFGSRSRFFLTLSKI